MAKIALFATVLLMIGGCSSDAGGTRGTDGDAGGATTASSPGAAVSPSSVDDPPGLIACRQVATALRDATLMDAGVVERITASSGTADAPVADAASVLADAYATALAERGKPGEPDAIAAVSGAAADMSEICGQSGLDSVR